MSIWRPCVPSVLSLFFSLLVGAPHASTETLLSCDFEAEPLDEIIATGGAALGQPIDLGGISAHVRSAPMATASLELTDDWGPNARAVSFEFLNDAEISSGVVEISMNLWFSDLGNYNIGVRQQGSFATSFLTISFQEAGVIRYSDSDTVAFDIIGNYSPNTAYSLRVVFDLDQDTYDIHLDGSPLLEGGTWAATSRGIGRVYVGHAHDTDASGTYSVDDILVTATESPTSVEPASWAGVKSLYR